jgi:hypothetical protein
MGADADYAGAAYALAAPPTFRRVTLYVARCHGARANRADARVAGFPACPATMTPRDISLQ